MKTSLQQLLTESSRRFPDRIAISDPRGARVTYRELEELSDGLRDRLAAAGIQPGDRVGIYLRKSVDAVASVFGILKAGAAYVPVDPEAPVERSAFILRDCSARAVVAGEQLAGVLRRVLSRSGSDPVVVLELPDSSEDPIPLRSFLAQEQRWQPVSAIPAVAKPPRDPAYILYTSGSTGSPKGVVLSHEAALSFVDWCSSAFDPTPDDVFSSHAPLHFDLSIHDVFVSIKHGARLVLIDEALGKDPQNLARTIAEHRISIWYSTPSILSLLTSYGKLDRHDYSALRLVLFAGEVFPVARLRAVQGHWPHPRYVNLYGPTETNVCTYHEIPRTIPLDRTEPFPIGRICPPLRARVVDGEGADVPSGQEGELIVSGAGVMTGYWNLPGRNAEAFLIDSNGTRWYRTGDLVVRREDGVHLFHGRRDRMVKRRGYRIELGEIEAALGTHPKVREVAAIAVPSPDTGVGITAVMSLETGARASIIAFKQFSAEKLPRYMIPDSFSFVDALPRTSTDKIDYQTLKAGIELGPVLA